MVADRLKSPVRLGSMDAIRNQTFVLVVGSLALLGSGGCHAPLGDTGVTAVQFDDAYVPASMRLRTASHQSHSIEVREASYRHGHFEYTGSGSIDALAEDILRRMPESNWRLAEDSGTASSRFLRFVREPYVAEYQINRDQSITRMVVDYLTQTPEQR